MSKLEWKLLTKKRESATKGVPPGKEALAWVTNTVTLIYGERDAVVVDTFLSAEHSRELLDWVVASGKNLTIIYITHGHGDHFFGLKLLLDRFPNAKAIATAGVVAAIRDQIKPEYVKSFWEARFPGQLPSQLAAPEVLKEDTFYLEREELKVVELGHTDTSHSTALYVPSIGLMVAGDGVSIGTHCFLLSIAVAIVSFRSTFMCRAVRRPPRRSSTACFSCRGKFAAPPRLSDNLLLSADARSRLARLRSRLRLRLALAPACRRMNHGPARDFHRELDPDAWN
jgi:glyoxylase-like metal-dependent hydrolase (beta-lactamase superfamily II)